jgi:Cytochrome P460
MKSRIATTMLIICASACPSVFGEIAGAPASPLLYTSDGRLERPDQFREWIFLTSGFDMSYSADRQMGHHAFDNVFVNPAAYRAFLATGTWPDQTVLVIENRAAEGRGSINKSGNYQGTKVAGLEVHVKDAARFAGGWAFFEFEGAGAARADKAAGMIPRSSECYSCHAAHAAVDTTFVQFYPTLRPIAEARGTFLERN